MRQVDLSFCKNLNENFEKLYANLDIIVSIFSMIKVFLICIVCLKVFAPEGSRDLTLHGCIRDVLRCVENKVDNKGRNNCLDTVFALSANVDVSAPLAAYFLCLDRIRAAEKRN